LLTELEQMGNPLIAWTPSNIFTMKRPLESGAGGGEEIVMMDEARAIVEYKVSFDLYVDFAAKRHLSF
jgi:hypothetical protein